MEKFIYNNTVEQQSEVLCHAYSLEILNGNTGDLENFYRLLHQYFPHSEHEGKKTLYDHESLYSLQWHAARAHVAKLIEDRKTKVRHLQIWIVALLTLFVLVATLADTVLSRPRAVENQLPAHTRAR